MIVLCFSFLIISAILFEIFYKKSFKDAAKHIPGPKPLPFIGNAHLLIGSGSDIYKLFKQYTEDYGEIMRVLIGSELYVILNSALYVEHVVNNSSLITKSDNYYLFHPWLGTGLLTSDGSKWRSRRKMITPAFHFKVLEKFVSVFDKNSDALIKKLAAYAGKDAINVYPFITLCALDVISESAMGVSVNAQQCENSEYVKSVKNLLQIIFARTKSALNRFDIFFNITKESKVHNEAIRVLHTYTNKIVKERKQMLANNEIETEEDDSGIKKKMAFLDLLLRSTCDGEKLNDDDVREEVDTFLFEGHDTTTSGISFCLHSIANNKDVQRKLFEEQEKIFGENLMRSTTYVDLQNMKYMEMVIKESLRLYPSVPLIGRKAKENIELENVFVPEGSTILLNLMSLHKDPKVFPDPDNFIPERFLPEECAKRNPYSYLAFSAGSRNCIGQKFAMLEMKSVISKIIRNYKLLPVDGELDLSSDIILVSNNGINIKIERRQ